MRLGLGDRGLLRLDLLADTRDRRLLGGEFVARGVDRQPIVAVVDAGDHLAGMHIGVVGDVDGRDIAGDLGGERRGIGVHIGVVGGDDVAADREPVVAEPATGAERERCHEADQSPLRQLAGARGRDGRAVSGRSLGMPRGWYLGSLIPLGFGQIGIRDGGQMDGAGRTFGGIGPAGAN